MISIKLETDDLNNDLFWRKFVGSLRLYLMDKELSNKILNINLKEIAYDDTSIIPKLEHKN